MDLSARQELNAALEDLTHSGRPNLDPQLMKRVKGICKESDSYVRVTYETLMKDLAKDHSEVRFSSFQVMNELFLRSHLFRELLTADFQWFVSLTCGTDPAHSLPPPFPAAERLKEESLLAIRQWVEKFGEGYPKLKIGFNFLRHNKRVDFQELQAQSEAEQRRSQEREDRQRALLQQRLDEVLQEMRGQWSDIQTCLTEMEACFQLLLPRFDLSQSRGPGMSPSTLEQARLTVASSSSPSSREEEEEEEEEGMKEDGKDNEAKTQEEEEEEESELEGGVSGLVSAVEDQRTALKDSVGSDSDDDSEVEWEEVEQPRDLLQEHGIAGHSYSLTIELPGTVEVVEQEGNVSIIATLKERQQLVVNKFLPAVSRWIQWFTKAGREDALKQAIDLKGQLTAAQQKFSDLNIISEQHQEQQQVEEGGEKGRELEEERQGEGTVSSTTATPPPPIVQSTSELQSRCLLQSYSQSTMQELELDPTTPQAQIAILRRKRNLEATTTSSKPKHMSSSGGVGGGGGEMKDNTHSQVPVLPYDVDLYSWSSGAVPEPVPVQLGSFHRFLSGPDPDMVVNQEQQAHLRYRTIAFTGKFQPVKQACRAPLPSGQLCPRMDRHKCPFHGPIIPRDDHGTPLDIGSSSSSFSSSSTTTTSTTSTTTLFEGSSTGSAGPQLLSWRDIADEVCQAQGLKVSDKKCKKGGKRRKKKHPGLTDLATIKDTPRKRVERKIMNVRSLKRVAASLDELSAKVGQDKFADNFNYALRQ